MGSDGLCQAVHTVLWEVLHSTQISHNGKIINFPLKTTTEGSLI